MMKLIYIFLIGLLLVTTSCNKSNSSNSTAATSYYWNGSACYSSATGQAVVATLCSTTGQMVDYAYCNNSTGGVVSMQCNGQFYYNNQVVSCYGTYCSGCTLIEVASGRQVRCL